MTKAETLLSNVADSHLVNPAKEPHIVIDTERYIHVPKELQRLAVQYDHQVETVTFDCPRYWDGLDMSKMYIYVNFLRPDRVRGRYLCKNVQVDASDENIMHFTWTIEQDVTLAKGKLRFLVCIMKTGDDGGMVNHWNSELNDECYISEGMECEDLPEEFYPEIITDLLTRMDNILLANDPLVLDTSLTEEGLAAEAKTVGDRFAAVETRVRYMENYVTPQMFGAAGDGETNDVVYLTDAAAAGETVELCGDTYLISSSLVLNNVIRNGTIIYAGPDDTPVIQLRNGGGLKNVTIIIKTANYASSVILADYTIYDAQFNSMRWCIDDVRIDNTITTNFIEGSSCIHIVYDKYKVITSQNMSNVYFTGRMDYGIYIEPKLRNENDGPVFNTCVFSNMWFRAVNCALYICPTMAEGKLDNAKDAVKLVLNNFANQHVSGITKPFIDIHNTEIEGQGVIPWDYYGSNIPADGTYKTHNSIVLLDLFHFGENTNDNVYYKYRKVFNDETYAYLPPIKMTEISSDFNPLRDTGINGAMERVKFISTVPSDEKYNVKHYGLLLQSNNNNDPAGNLITQLLVRSGTSTSTLWLRKFFPDTGTWGDRLQVYSVGSMPTSGVDRRTDGVGVGDMRFDVDLKKPIWWNGSAWVTADGTVVT